jgi:hypothetical protein
LIDTFGLFAFQQEQLATRRRSESLGAPGAVETASVQSRPETHPSSDTSDDIE